MPKNKAAVYLGRLSAAKREKIGHNSEYYAILGRKSAESRKAKKLSTEASQNDLTVTNGRDIV